MLHTLSLLLALPLTLACDSGDATADSGDTAVEGDSDTDTDTDTDTDADADGRIALSGVVTALSGEPLAMARVSLCKDSCYFAEADASGEYRFDPLEPATYSFEIVPKGEDWPSPLVPYTLQGEGPEISLAVPYLEAGSPMPSARAEVQAAQGIWITLSVEELTLPFGADGSMVRAVRVPEEHMPPIEGVSGSVLAAWYLTPFDAHSDPGMGVRIDAAAIGLADGAEVQLWAADYLSASWKDAGKVTVAGGEIQSTQIPVLSTLLITAP